MEVIDAVPADSLEEGDTISHGGDECYIRKVLDSPDNLRVLLEVHNYSSDMVEPLSLPFDLLVPILGV